MYSGMQLPQPFGGSGMSAGLPGNISTFLSGLFGNPSAPFDAANQQYQNYFNQAQNIQNPFVKAGQSAIGNQQNLLQQMSNPSQFVNNLTGQYQESPYQKYLQDQSFRQIQNGASAQGLIGSTPFLQAAQENSTNLGQQGLDSWLQSVLGVNNASLKGNQDLIGTGANSANALTDLLSKFGGYAGNASAGAATAQNQQMNNLFSGGLGMLGNLFFGI